MSDFKLLIGGELVSSNRTLDVVNPATEEVFTTVPLATQDDAERAVQAAKSAFPAWSATSWDERRKALGALADAIEANLPRLAETLTREQGKPLREAQQEAGGMAAFLRFYTTLELPPQTIQDDDKGLIQVHRRPLGVVVGIVPWNYPLLLAAWKLGPALLAGNTIVLKPAPTTPATTLIIGELAQSIFPAGVVNIITDNNDLGPYLTAHPDVAKVGFTGSTQTGKHIMTSAAGTLKRLTLELGGNDPAIILNDVDIQEMALKLYFYAFSNSGQVCTAVKRAYVHADIYDQLSSAVAEIAKATVIGDGMDDETKMGPVQNKRQFDVVKDLLASAKEDGEIIAGGEVPEKAGYFIPPTVVKNIKDGARLVDEEQFGPLLPLIRFENVDEVIDHVNSMPFGLGASVWTKDTERGMALAQRIESGSVWVNKHADIKPFIPMAGYKQSGIGVEQAADGLKEYTQIQVLNAAR